LAIAGVVANLIFTGTSLAALMTLAVINSSTNLLSAALCISDFQDFQPFQTIASVVHVLVYTPSKCTTRMTNAVIDWQA